MNPQPNANGFIYLDQNGLLLYVSTLPTVIQFPFPPDIVRDLEVINKQLLEKELTSIMQSNNIPSTKFIVGLSPNLLFEKSTQNAKTPEGQKEMQLFLDNIPFEHIGTIIFENAESKFIATNKDFYQTFAKILTQAGSVVLYTMPVEVLGIDVNQALAMTPQLLADLHRRATSLKQYAFLTDSQSLIVPSKKEIAAYAAKEKVASDKDVSSPVKPEDKKRIMLLAGVFAVLLIVLGVVYYLSTQSS